MGSASTIGLGIALAQPGRRVIVVDGDGSLLMQLGSLVTIAGAAPANLLHFVFENGVYETSGSQPLPGEGRFDLADMARGAGYAQVASFSDAADLSAALPRLLRASGAGVRVVTDPARRRLPPPQRGRHPARPPDAQSAPAATSRSLRMRGSH